VCASIDARAWSSRGTCSARLPDFGRRYACRALAQGLLLRPIGHTLYAMPPYVIDEAEGELLAKGALAALQATLAEETGPVPVSGVPDGV
jgi:adenosylmethionine-8-amino-7-oxononanoate aminotransferase